MSKSIFQNPKKAGLFVGGTMVAVMLLIGSNDQEGALVQAAAAVEGGVVQSAGQSAGRSTGRSTGQNTNRPASQPVRQQRRAVEQSPPVTWADNEDLIDDTIGFDPTPKPIDPQSGDVYYVEGNSR